MGQLFFKFLKLIVKNETIHTEYVSIYGKHCTKTICALAHCWRRD